MSRARTKVVRVASELDLSIRDAFKWDGTVQDLAEDYLAALAVVDAARSHDAYDALDAWDNP